MKGCGVGGGGVGVRGEGMWFVGVGFKGCVVWGGGVGFRGEGMFCGGVGFRGERSRDMLRFCILVIISSITWILSYMISYKSGKPAASMEKFIFLLICFIHLLIQVLPKFIQGNFVSSLQLW